jgi:hypothetical protein
MESLLPFLQGTCTPYNMPVYPGAQRIIASVLIDRHECQKVGSSNIIRWPDAISGGPPANGTLPRSRRTSVKGKDCRRHGINSNHRVGISGACIKGKTDASSLVAIYQH